ncbi:hypothetical protein LB504_010518 [Fusarium proliferatum]|nr:hypothetical protein LB504_010518 [Fusarium proliferatum]
MDSIDGTKQNIGDGILCDLPPTTDRFFGREAELLEMVGYLETTTQRKGVVLCGISGSGKTQLVREYVARRNEKFSAILWIDASSDESTDESFSICSSRICEATPEFRSGRESSSPRELVIEWLRKTRKKKWLTVIDNANGLIPNKRLLGPFRDIRHGSLCITSTNQVTSRALQLKQIVVEYLDPQASKSLLLWRAYENDTEYGENVSNAAGYAAKLLGGFPLALELAGVLHRRGITNLEEFAEAFTRDYPDLAQFELDSGVWIWTKNGAFNSLFSMLDSLYKSILAKSKESAHLITFCSIYGPSAIPISLVSNLELIDMGNTDIQDPWKQLQALAQSKIKLNKAIDELSKIFLATKKQANDYNLLSFTLHASICQWRLATVEDRDTWIIQATYNLSKHILSLHDRDQVFRFYNVFNRCLHLLWQYIDARHIVIHGKFAEAYLTICLCGADLYLSSGKSETAIKLFTWAIEYIQSSRSNPDENILLQLLCGLARSCENRREFESAEEALSSAATLSERLNGHMDDLTVSLVSQLKTVRTHMSSELENRKRALIASTGPKLAPTSNINSLLEPEYEKRNRQRREIIPEEGGYESSTNVGSSELRRADLLHLAWELRSNDPILVFSLEDDGDPFSGLSGACPMAFQGRLNIMTYEPFGIKSIYIEIDISGRKDSFRKGEQRAGDPHFQCWRLRLFDAHAIPDAKFGNCTFVLGDGDSQENARQPENNGVNMEDHVFFPPGSYSYSFESPIDCLYAHAENSAYQHWNVCAVMSLSGFYERLHLRKQLPVIQIPNQLKEKRRIPINQLSRPQNSGISFSVDLPYKLSPIGGKIPITVALGPVNNGFRADYLTYFIVQRRKGWTQSRATEADEQKHKLLERFRLDESTAARDKTDQGETAFSHDSDRSLTPLFDEDFLPSLGTDAPVPISDDLMLPTCKQIEAGRLVGQEPLKLSSVTPFMETKHFIQVTVGGSRPDPNKSESRIQLETTEELPITIIDCQITRSSGILTGSMACESSPRDNTTAVCGCPDADNLKETVFEGGTPVTNRHSVNASLLTTTST